jgi:preprotein translocase subunit SecF
MVVRFLKFSKFYFIFSLFLAVLSITALLLFDLNWGIDFVGGSVLKISYSENRPSHTDLSTELNNIGLNNFSLRLRGENEIVIRMSEIGQDLKNKISEYFYNSPNVENEKLSFESVSPIVGEETKSKALRAVFYSVIAIILYVAFVFRKVSKPIRSWQYGIATVVALVHDVLIPLGLFAILGHYLGIEFSVPILTALLTIFGYSVNDTVVVLDRIRENLLLGRGEDFSDLVNISLNQTLVRSINTSFTTFLVLLAIYLFGGESLSWFALALIAGVIAGTYSSIFLASPLLVKWLAFAYRD